MENICLALREIALEREDVIVLYPVHLNPNVQTPVYGILANQPGVELVDPVDYPAFVHLLRESFLSLPIRVAFRRRHRFSESRCW